MKMESVKRKIEKLGGTAKYQLKQYQGGSTSYDLVGTLKGWDIHMSPNGRDMESSYYTVRRISDRGYFDPGSDYNPSGWTFCHKIKELEYCVNNPAGYAIADEETKTILVEVTHINI